MLRRRAKPRYDVAFYVPWIGPLLTQEATTPTGGAETQIYLLARALAQRGARVRLLAFNLPGVALPDSVDGVDVALRPPYRAHERYGKLREVAAIARSVVSADARVVVTTAAGPHVGLAGLFSKLTRRHFVHSTVNVSDFDFGRLERKRRNRALFRLGMRLADEIVVQTDEQVHMCEQQFGRTPVQIGCVAESAPERRRRPEAFLWVGRLVWYKRPLAYVDLARSRPEAKFWMIGVPVPLSADSAELAGEVRRRAEEVPNLEILEPRPRNEVFDLVERSVAMVNTSDFEGMPNVFLEAWGRSVPALALSHDPDGVIERHGLGAFADGSADRLSELADGLWRSKEDQSDVAARCRVYIEAHHSSDAVASRWFDALRVKPPPPEGQRSS